MSEVNGGVFIGDEKYNALDTILREQVNDVLRLELGECLQYEYSNDVVRKLERLGEFELAEKFSEAVNG